MLGPSFVSGGQQVFEFVKMMAHNEVYLRCAQLANASRVLGNLGDDVLSKITLKSGVGSIVETTGTSWRLGQQRAPPGPCYMCYMCYMGLTRQAAEPPQSPGSLLYVLYVLYGSYKASR